MSVQRWLRRRVERTHLVVPQRPSKGADKVGSAFRDVCDAPQLGQERSLTREEVDAEVEDGDGVGGDELAVRLVAGRQEGKGIVAERQSANLAEPGAVVLYACESLARSSGSLEQKTNLSESGRRTPPARRTGLVRPRGESSPRTNGRVLPAFRRSVRGCGR